MNGIFLLVLSALGLGSLALVGFFWALRAGQYDDLQGAAERIFIEDDESKGV